MYKKTNEGLPTPTANIAINRSRIKVYGKNSKVPTYYLKKGQEFQIELFNPTKDTIMAKISLNGKPIAQGGLVLKPAQRVFLDRYIDVAKKFKFDTYEVANTSETRQAIEDNGDFKVEFYKERIPVNNNFNHNSLITRTNSGGTSIGVNNEVYYGGNTTRGFGGSNTTTNMNYLNTDSSNQLGIVGTLTTTSMAGATLDSLEFIPQELSRRGIVDTEPKKRKRSKKSKSIETGRVEAGSLSEQTLETVYMNWEYTPFHSIEYKMLPVSQKVNTVESISVKRYCTNCANKNKSSFKFCPVCGTKV